MMVSDFASEAEVEELRAKMGFDKPLHVQYGRFLSGALRGDLGDSIMQRRPAMPLVLSRVPATAKLTAFAFFFTLLVSIPLGVFAASRRGTLIDRGGLVFALTGQSIPNFWFGILLIILFSVHLKWLPSFGGGTWQHLVMPGITLGFGYAGVVTRVVRSTMVNILGEDYIRTARSKGVSERNVIYRHAFRNASLPIVTVLGLELGSLLSGSVITESVFAYPGVGFLVVQAIRAKDFPIVLSFVLLMGTIVLSLNLLVDILYGRLDPRIVYS